jgi:hypothetical protein
MGLRRVTKKKSSKKKRSSKKSGSKKAPRKKSGKKKWFTSGADQARDHVKREKARRNAQASSRFPRFFLKDGEEASVRFVTDEPVGYEEHAEQVNGRWEYYTCSGDEDCLGCKRGVRKSWRAAYKIIDRRTWTDRKGNSHSNEIKVLKVGIRAFPMVDKIQKRVGLRTRDVSIERTGQGIDTTYTFMAEEKSSLSRQDRIAIKKDQIDLMTALAPPDPAELASLLGEKADGGSDGYDFDDE